MLNSELGEFLAVIMVILAVLKAIGCITLSWWWILLPFWIAPAIVLAFVALVVAIALIAFLTLCIAVVFGK